MSNRKIDSEKVKSNKNDDIFVPIQRDKAFNTCERKSVIVYHYENKGRSFRSEKSGGKTIRKEESILKYATPQEFAKQLRSEGYSVRLELFNDQEKGILYGIEEIVNLYREYQIYIVNDYHNDKDK